MIKMTVDMAAELARDLGSAEGLERVEREMGELCERLGSAPTVIGREELERVSRSLAALSGAICAIDRAVRGRILRLSGERADVG